MGQARKARKKGNGKSEKGERTSILSVWSIDKRLRERREMWDRRESINTARKARNVGQARQETYTVLDKLIIIL